MIGIINAREEEQQKAMGLVALKTLEQEGDPKVPEENSKAMGMMAIIKAREEEQQKAVGLVAIKTPKQEGDPKELEVNSEAKGMIVIINAKYQGEEGEWKSREIKNPAYNGVWAHPEIDNIEYNEEDAKDIGKYTDNCKICHPEPRPTTLQSYLPYYVK